MKTLNEIKEKVEEAKGDIANTGKVNSAEGLAFQQGFIEALRWVMKDTLKE
jgi:hypothetical protein